MSEAPYMPFYVDDFDAATAHLTLEEDGLYNRMLRLMWRSPGCSLPDDPRWLCRQLRIDQETYIRIATHLIDEFCTRKNGKLFQRRLMREWQRVKTKIEAKKMAGKKGGDAKALKEKKMATAFASRLPWHPEPEPEPNILPTSSLVGADLENLEIHPSIQAALARQKARKW